MKGAIDDKYACMKPGCKYCNYKPADPVKRIVKAPKDRKNAWKPDEIEFLVRNFNSLSYERLGRTLQRGRRAIKIKASALKLGIKKRIHDI